MGNTTNDTGLKMNDQIMLELAAKDVAKFQARYNYLLAHTHIDVARDGMTKLTSNWSGWIPGIHAEVGDAVDAALKIEATRAAAEIGKTK